MKCLLISVINRSQSESLSNAIYTLSFHIRFFNKWFQPRVIWVYSMCNVYSSLNFL